MNKKFVIGAPMQGLRLDQAICRLCPELSLRGARRVINNGNVLLAGKKAAPALKVAAGGEIAIIFPDKPANAPVEAKLLARQGDFFFFYKPPKMHSAALAGGNNYNLENAIPDLLARQGIKKNISLLQRLDFETSGILAGAASEDAAKWYREQEKGGLCQKYYFAVLTGRLEEAVLVKNALDCAKRKKTRVLATEAQPNNWTLIEPIAYADNTTLARCMIKMGARHQIRAHTAFIGHCLQGDNLYGDSGSENFLLEHCHFKMPGHEIKYLDEESLIRELFGPAANAAMSGETEKCTL